MANLILKLLSQLKNHKRLAAELVLGALLALSVTYGTIVHKQNKSLSESLELAQNNIEAYQDMLSDSQQAVGVLKLDMTKLAESNDKLIQQIDSVRKENKIKSSGLETAATQTQSLLVSSNKVVQGDLVEILVDDVYEDSIQYNDLTSVYYCIARDSVQMTIDLKNTQYLYTYKTREYKNKKSFLKRLFTLDFKKVDKYKYTIVNTNDLLKESDIRIIQK